jgi:hypothetical protein
MTFKAGDRVRLVQGNTADHISMHESWLGTLGTVTDKVRLGVGPVVMLDYHPAYHRGPEAMAFYDDELELEAR